MVQVKLTGLVTKLELNRSELYTVATLKTSVQMLKLQFFCEKYVNTNLTTDVRLKVIRKIKILLKPTYCGLISI